MNSRFAEGFDLLPMVEEYALKPLEKSFISFVPVSPAATVQQFYTHPSHSGMCFHQYLTYLKDA